jgi:radical SAM protein with 4Fe4S-binding SPASM domain
MEVLTVDNHADGLYLLLWMQEHLPERVEEAHRLLRLNGGTSAGIGIGCIDERGFVHPDQFWRGQVLGNVRERPFSAIWQGSHPLLVRLREREPWLPPRCRACRFLPLCNGNLRARAEAATGDPWGIDPACYLTDAERAMGLAG